MEFRSTNPDGFAHFGGDLVSGVNSTLGIQHTSNVIQPVGDGANYDLVLKGKGTGGVKINASTSVFGGMNRGQSTSPLVQLPVSGLVYSTLTIPGLGVDDMLYIARPESSVVSTAIGMVGYSCTAANEAKIAFLNNLASTQSILVDTVFKWNYIKST
jgi:hypothetical protein